MQITVTYEARESTRPRRQGVEPTYGASCKAFSWAGNVNRQRPDSDLELTFAFEPPPPGQAVLWSRQDKRSNSHVSSARIVLSQADALTLAEAIIFACHSNQPIPANVLIRGRKAEPKIVPPRVGEVGGEPVPTLEDVRRHCERCGYEDVEPEPFHAYHERLGWGELRSWKEVLRFWNRRWKGQRERNQDGR